ncbi:hypothetical protein Vsou_14640 [Vulcanisaeta souniana JCM 11219]|uniref:Uncharacterized protein n=1 Tax=Vulcanisaeta souniana JCM 11219 TaxID=1293586 RepID=A0A830E225_9CREN|nr:hypothetical protein Vsou_14640 [Vulcanisaeta souniana JCM 11219]GGI75056.1 hypothetical protein GCM10007112_09820 [Vulcanisaeta souniana JCM 11219]
MYYNLHIFNFILLFNIGKKLKWQNEEIKNVGKGIRRCGEKILGCAFDTIVKARLGFINKDEALDALWEYLVNIDYDMKVLEKKVGMNGFAK